MLPHVLYLCELLASRVIAAVGWTGTRGMVAYGATQRICGQKYAATCMSGASGINHEVKLRKGTGKMHSVAISSASAASSQL